MHFHRRILYTMKKQDCQWLLETVDNLTKKISDKYIEEVRTEILILGIELLRKDLPKLNRVYFCLRNKKISTLRYLHTRGDVMETGVYNETDFYGIHSRSNWEDRIKKIEISKKFSILYYTYNLLAWKQREFLLSFFEEYFPSIEDCSIRPPKGAVMNIIKNFGSNKRNGLKCWTQLKRAAKRNYRMEVETVYTFEGFIDTYIAMIGGKNDSM